MMKKFMVFFVLATHFLGHGRAQTTFNHRLDFGLPAGLATGVLATDSCYYLLGNGVSGETGQVIGFFAKIDFDGVPVFMKELSVPGAWLFTREPAFVTTADGNFMVAGTAQDSIRRAYLVKLSPFGDTIFTRTHLHPATPEEDFLYVFDLLGTDDGGYMVFGHMADPENPDVDYMLFRTDSLGERLWTKSYDSDFVDFGVCIVPDGSGGFHLGGIHQNTNLLDEGYTFQAQIFHVDGEGELLGEYRTPDDYLSDWAHDMVLLEDGSLVVASGTGTEIDHPSVNTVDFEKSLFKLNPDGEKDWEITFPAPEPTSTATMQKVVQMSDGSGFVAAGAEGEILVAEQAFTIRGWLAKVSNEGTMVWERRYTVVDGLDNDHQFYDMAETPDGGLILCGEARDYSGQDSITQAAWLLKLDQYGCLVPGCQIFDSAEEEGTPEMELFMYPNPTTDYLNFQLRGPGSAGRDASFRITGAQGRTVREFAAGGRDETYIVPVWEWGGGVYFLQYVAGGQMVASEKFIITK